MLGLLNLNKPAGITSRDAVNRVQRRLRGVKVGHAGTLDPLADGVLVLCLGRATKLISHVQQMPKTYQATFRLGCHSESDDIETETHELPAAPIPSREAFIQVLPRFLGSIEQTPSQYSAVKIGGKRAYQLAREGEQVEMPSRTVQIDQLELVAYDYPRLELKVQCGSGTYIRSLGRDLALALGTRAVMSALTRTAIGPFELRESINADTLSVEVIEQALVPPARAVSQLPRRVLTPSEQEEIAHGRFIEPMPGEEPADEIAGLDQQGRLLAILGPRGAGQLGTRINFIARN